MHSPDVLFLDEPTNNLDPQSRLFLWERIRSLNEQGLTILLTTHDMDEADRLCGRIAIMDHGRILVNDTSAELKKLIPGGNSIELRVRIEGDGMLDGLRAIPGAEKVDRVEAANAPEDGPGISSYRVYSETAKSLVGAATQAVLAAGGEVRDLHVRQASLEDVFIYLTGRQLR
jgi:ABC-2 type transport system ATP-binding protein